MKFFIGLIKHLLLKKPFVLVIETGTACNINCPTCPTPRDVIAKTRTEKNMELEKFKKIINNAYRSFSAVLLYWSNEPLLNKDLVKMVRYCNEKNLYTFISTNVTLLSANIFSELIDAGLDELLVCVDGFSAESFEIFRKGAKFETVKMNIENACALKKKLRAFNPWIEIQYVENRLNSSEIVPCMEWSKNTGVDGFRVQELYIARHLRDYKNLRKEYYTDELWDNKGDGSSGLSDTQCKTPDSQVCVLVNGNVTLCCYDIRGDCCFGNLIEDSFKTISRSRKYLDVRKKGLSRKLGICKEC